MTPEICIGSAQFGMPYGITNTIGQVTTDIVKEILSNALTEGVKYIDTAQAYGSSEKAIGECTPLQNHFRIISKLKPQKDYEYNVNIEDLWEKDFFKSLNKLKVERLYGFLLHRSQDLRGRQGARLLRWLISLQDRSLVENLGISIYSSDELEYIPLEVFKIIQLPLSIYDQRLVADGTIKKLNNLGISIHARSIFMQGLILEKSSNWPNHLSRNFKDHHRNFYSYLQTIGLSPLDISIAYIKQFNEIDAALFGLAGIEQFNQLIESWNKSIKYPSKEEWGWGIHSDVDPREWN